MAHSIESDAVDRDNASWLTALRSQQSAALVDLRTILLRNLRTALSGRAQADESFLEDCVQESLLQVLARLDQFAGRSRFVSWATAITIRIALGQLRRKRWKDVSLDELVSDGILENQRTIDPEPTPQAQSLRRELLDALDEAIDGALTARQRTALLAELKGMPLDEIARRLGSNRNAVYKLTHDARKRLKQRLAAGGFSADDLAASAAV